MGQYGQIAYDDFSHLNAQWQEERPAMAGLGSAYGQHAYTDVSYLNARLRPLYPSQVGLSPDGMGGGSLGGNSLGADDPGFTKAQVQEAQDQMNGALVQAGYAPITVDGDLGPATCGAITWYQQNVNAQGGVSFASACASVTPKPPAKAGSATPHTYVAPATPTKLPGSSSAGMFGPSGGTNWMLWGGAVGLAAVGAALMFRASKRR